MTEICEKGRKRFTSSSAQEWQHWQETSCFSVFMVPRKPREPEVIKLIISQKEPKLGEIIESEFCKTGSLDEGIELLKSCGGIERAQELAKEKADLAIQNLSFLPKSSFRVALEDMVKYNLEKID